MSLYRYGRHKYSRTVSLTRSAMQHFSKVLAMQMQCARRSMKRAGPSKLKIS